MASVDSSGNIENSAINGSQLSAAQKLQQKHEEEAHKATIEDVPDEDDLKHGEQPENLSGILEGPGDASAPGWVPPVSANAAGKRKEEFSQREDKPLLDTQSEELFPGLGGSKPKQPTNNTPLWKVGKPTGTTNGTNGVSSNGTSTPTSGMTTPQSAKAQATPWGTAREKFEIPGQQTQEYFLNTNQMIPRAQLKKPLPELLKDINKRSKANVSFKIAQDGIKFVATGPQVAGMQALKDVVAIVGAKISIKVPVPQSSKAFIIGKQGSMIKQLQEKTGARIQIPKTEDSKAPVDDDDDVMIDVTVEGNVLSVATAQDEINKIVSERTAPVNAKLRTIPAEYYPFIASDSKVSTLDGVRVHVPTYHTWTVQPPPQAPANGQRPVFQPAAGDNHITLTGDRAAVQEARAQIETLVKELEMQLTIEQFNLERSRHQFIIGKPGITAQKFFNDTGCAIILPGDEDEDMITIIGRAERTQDARDRAVKLAGDMNAARVDISRQHRNAPGGGTAHAKNITQYLRQRKAIEQLELLHQTHIVTAFSQEGVAPWEVYARDYNNSINAQTAIKNIVTAHPPSRFASIEVNPFYHKYLRDGITPIVKKDFGVHVVTPPSEADTAVLLVFEGDAGLDPRYEVPRGQPSNEDIRAFQKGLADARKHILDIISAQAQIKSTAIDVPHIFHEKLRKFIKSEQSNRAADEIPVRVNAAGTVVTLKGPAPAVDSLTAKVTKFVAQAQEDEKERGFTLSFDFPQNHAKQLIGKGGSNIRELRDKFDVEINVDEGKVELKGPKAKADAAKAHISALGRQWADETTYVLKIEPKYHRELIGAQGNVINKLQTRYNVQIHFPRSARPAKDDQSNADAASEAGGRKPRREQELDEVVVKGPKKGADGARDEILELLQYNKDNNHTASVTVQQSQIPSLIGQRGREMDLLRESTGARIDVPNAKDAQDTSGRVEIQIKGTKAQVAQAKKLLEEKKTVFDQTIIENLDVNKKHHSALIGAGGSTLRDIIVKAGGSDDRRDLARTVQFPKNGSEGNSIKIEGKKEVVEKIIAAMQQIIAERDSQTTEAIEVPTDKHRSLIGRGGETKKDLESKFKVSIDIPRQGSGQTSVKIAGQPADVEKAKAHLLSLIKDQAGETLQVPRKIHHTIADNGQFFRKLRNDHQVKVDHAGVKVPPKPAAPANARGNSGVLPLITDDVEASSNAHSWNVVDIGDSDLHGEIPWVLSGDAENVAKAKNTLAAAIEQALKNTTTGYLVLPDPRTYRYVIGQGGSKVNSIRKATGCKITVPRDQAKDEAIEISGSLDGVEMAKEMVLKAVEEGRSGANGRS